MNAHIPPAPWVEAFNCVNCGVYARQAWFYLQGSEMSGGSGLQCGDRRFNISQCEYCNFPTIWHGDQIVYPLNLTADPPNDDLPDNIKDDYNEARSIVNLSPRGAAALLRLSIQKLCSTLGKTGKNINSDIQSLVEKGLPTKVQEALDSVRVIGNSAVHPGELDLRDDRDTAYRLFKLVNFIAEKMITEPREIEELYSTLPEDKKEGIRNRDRH